jgi:hypothetical protein
MSYQINRQASAAAQGTTATGASPGGSRAEVAGRGEAMRVAVAVSWKAMARGI